MRDKRQALIDDHSLVGPALREALDTLTLQWLTDLLGDPGPGIALVAVGGFGRHELAPASDLDLVLVHDGRRNDVGAVADAVWYPVWDSGVGLDHSVRTVEQAVEVASGDLKAALGLLDARHLAGDSELSADLISRTRASWRASARKRLPELRAAVAQRAVSHGEIAFLLEPELKEGRGGLRDVHALQALAVAQVADPPTAAVRAACAVLLDARGELHRRTSRGGRRVIDRLLMQEQDAVAALLAYDDADALMAAVSAAARTIAYASDTTWRRALPAPSPRGRFGRRQNRPERRPLAEDVVEQEGEVVLARDADPAHDPVLPLRVGQAAAWADLPIAPGTLDRLASVCPPLPVPWPRPALDAFVGMLAAGHPAVRVVESLDHAGLLEPLLPEWGHVRSRPQRNSYHRFTIDRHLLETAANAADLTRRVSRPDLLLLGALLHDIGKGLPGDHTEVGMRLIADLGPRLGLADADTQVLTAMVQHHLLLPDAATRRDLEDPATARAVADAVGSVEVLELLHGLTEADSIATGPAAWSSWKARLVADLVRRTTALLAGAPLPPRPSLADWQEELIAAGTFALAARDDEVTVVAPDRSGILAQAAGVIALHRLDVRSASVFNQDGAAVVVLRVAPRFGSMPDWTLVREDLRRALDGDLALMDVLKEREQAYARPTSLPAAPPTVRLVDDASERATVVEVRAADSLGVLHRMTAALVGCGLDVRTAHVSTLGADVVDAFYVVGPDGLPVTDPDLRGRIEADVLAALA